MSRPLNKMIVVVLSTFIAASWLGACGGGNAPTPTPQPTATLQSGWKRFEGKNVSIALPDTFEGGSLSGEDQKLIVDKLKSLGKEYENFAMAIEQNPDLYLLFVLDTAPTKSGVLTNVNVTSEKVLSAISPKTYMEAAAKQLPTAWEVKSQEESTISGRPAGRMIIEWASMNIKEALYVIKDNNTIYAVTFATGIDDFAENQPTFEQSIQSFDVHP